MKEQRALDEISLRSIALIGPSNKTEIFGVIETNAKTTQLVRLNDVKDRRTIKTPYIMYNNTSVHTDVKLPDRCMVYYPSLEKESLKNLGLAKIFLNLTGMASYSLKEIIGILKSSYLKTEAGFMVVDDTVICLRMWPTQAKGKTGYYSQVLYPQDTLMWPFVYPSPLKINYKDIVAILKKANVRELNPADWASVSVRNSGLFYYKKR